MPIKNGVYFPDFESGTQQPQWTNFPQEQQVDISPAVGAFQPRFMQGAPTQGHEAPNMPQIAPHESPDAMKANKGGGIKSL